MNKLLFRAFWLICALSLVGGACFSIRLAIADWKYQENTVTSLTEAIRLAPGSAPYHLLLAEHLEGTGSDPKPELQTAAALSPSDSRFLIRLAFQAEVQGDYQCSEEYLLRAAKIDRMFAPRWALMNFYFRQQATAQFWYWTKKALEMSYGDRSPIFTLMWYVTENEALIESYLPANKEILSGYLVFLTINHPEAGENVASRLAASADSTAVPILLQYCDHALQAHPATVLGIWNTLCMRKLLPYVPLRPKSGEVITNGNFAVPSVQEVFDWRIPSVEGIAVRASGDGDGFIAELSGDEPEEAPLIYQMIPVQEDYYYELSFGLRSLSGKVSGLKWLVYKSDSASPFYTSAELRPDMNWKTSAFRFRTSFTGAARIALQYHREPGTTRAEGTLGIRRISGHPVP